MSSCQYFTMLCMVSSVLGAAFVPEEARRVYAELSTNSAVSVVQEAGEFVFLDVKWTIPEEASSEDEKGELELLALSDALEAYVVPPHLPVTDSPFSEPLTAWLVPDVPYQIPPVANTVVKLEESATECRKVFAFEAEGLKSARKAAQALEASRHGRGTNEWESALAIYAKTLKTAQDWRQFCVLLGCPIVNYIADQTQIGSSVAGAERGLVELDILTSWTPSEGSFFASHPGVLWQNQAKLAGGLFYPAWAEDDGGCFAEALALCRKKDWKNDMDKILDLIAESIGKNPISAEKWLYLGGVLLEKGQPLEALVAYIQSLKFAKDGTAAWKGIQKCCKVAGLTTNADGLSWYLKLKK